jgi:hypothetical protein
MDLHEFQAKELLARFGVEIPQGLVVEQASDAERAAERLGSRRFVVKAQIKAGDRAQQGGVRFRDQCSGGGCRGQRPPRQKDRHHADAGGRFSGQMGLHRRSH